MQVTEKINYYQELQRNVEAHRQIPHTLLQLCGPRDAK